MAIVCGSLPRDRSELKVVNELKRQLPHDWLVIPGVRWAVRDRHGWVRDGEADVVVLAPGLGMLVLEVKGSTEIRISEAAWERREGDRWIALDRSPVEQATNNAHQLARLVCEARGWGVEFPGLFGWIAVYPNGHAVAVPATLDRTTLASRRDMSNLLGKVRDALQGRGHPALGAKFTHAVAEAARAVLTAADFRIVPADGADEVASEKSEIDHLTRQQFAALQGLFELPAVAVVGPAGSGKTVLAIWRLEALVSEGKNAIYVCYNKGLAEFLRLRNPSLHDRIHSVDRLFGQTCPGFQRAHDAGQFHREVLPNAVFDAVSSWAEDRKYDAVIVDEGQDLGDTQIVALWSMKKREGAWSIFLDRRQDLYKHNEDEVLAADVTYRLRYNCRNTVAINRQTNTYLGSAIESLPGMPKGVKTLVGLAPASRMAEQAFEAAARWAGEGLSVAILGPYALENSVMAGRSRGHGLELTTAISELGKPGKVYYSTVKSFKGIEADCVVLVDASIPGSAGQAFTREDLYVACTRARNRLAVFTADDASAAYFGTSCD